MACLLFACGQTATPSVDASLRDVTIDDGSPNDGTVDSTSMDAAFRDAFQGDAAVLIDSGANDAQADGPLPIDAMTVDAAARDSGAFDASTHDAGPCIRQYRLSPTGDDDAPVGAPLRTLAEVHRRLVASPPTCDVDVSVAPGLYRSQRVAWTFTMAEHRITIHAEDTADRPVFDGCEEGGACAGGTFFQLRASDGEPTNLSFRYLRVQNYSTAFSFNGNRNTPSANNGHNVLYGMYFDRIGGEYSDSGAPSTACIRLVNSDHNTIANSHFVDIRNGLSPALLHAIYVAHNSGDNIIRANRFLRNTGDPVRIRDASDNNVVQGNRFLQSGNSAPYSHWYCDSDVRTDCTRPAPECPSWGNELRDNIFDGLWNCDDGPYFVYHQDEMTADCVPPSPTARRLRTSGNSRATDVCSD